MDLTPTAQQRDITDSVRSILARTPRSQSARAELETARFGALAEAGFLDLIQLGGSRLDATLVVDEAAAAATCAPVAAKVLIAPALAPAGQLPMLLGLVSQPHGELVRFGSEAEAFLVVDGDVAVLATRADVTVVPQQVRWGYPAARVTVHGGQRLEAGSGPALLRAWRTGLAAEAGGLMRAAVRMASEYVCEREQFGRPIGVFQSVQHRLARGWVLAEGATWLARRAAWFEDDDVAAAVAATYACDGMREVFRSVHQVVGAMGVTDELGLTRLTGKMAYLHTELGGAAGNARAVAGARWRTPVGVGA